MKRKFILLALMCLTLMGGVKFNVLNAQDESCTVEFILRDSYADGWDQNKLTVSYGSFSTTFTLPSGNYEKSEFLSIPTSQYVTVNYSATSWASDDSFTIKYSETDEIVIDRPQSGSGNISANEDYFFTVDCSPKAPAAPTLKAEVTGESTIALSWNDVGGAENYNIYNGDGIVLIEDLTTTNYTVENLNPNTQYCFTVKAENEVGESDASNEACATTLEEGASFISIGEGTVTTYYAPIYNYNYTNSTRYTMTQMLYTSTELGGAEKVIESIQFNKSAGNNNVRNISVYLMNTDKEYLSNTFESLSDAVCVYNGNYTFGSTGWIEIDFTTSFVYSGNNLLVCVVDNTGTAFSNGYDNFYAYNTGSSSTNIRATYSTSSSIDPLNQTLYASAVRQYENGAYTPYRIPQVKFLVKDVTPSVEVSETSIALGDVRMDDNFFTEKTSSQDVEVKVTSTTVTDVSCDNSFFTLTNIPTGDDLGKTFTFKVGYKKEANVTDTQNGTITIKWQDGEDITISVSATPYTATEPDAMEVVGTISFANNTFEDTPTFANLHDDYILPGETEDGNTPDAIYEFTLDTELTLSASIKGNDIENSFLAVYNAETMGDGPSSNNYDSGVSTAPTTFGPFDFNDSSLSGNDMDANGDGNVDFTLIDKDGDGRNWEIYSAYGASYLVSYSYNSSTSQAIDAKNYLVTAQPYLITENSELVFKAASSDKYYPDKYNVEISFDGENFTPVVSAQSVDEISFTEKTANLGAYAGKSCYIAIVHESNNCMSLYIDDVKLTDGSSKSRAAGLATIEGVPYPAGTYYLVAAADKAFTVEAKIEGVPAPEEFALTAPTDEATEQDNPKLTWEASKYASSYNVYLGTSEDLTDVEPIEVTSNFYQTEDLSNNKKYYWTVEAVNNNEDSPTETTSGTWSFVTTLDVPQDVATSNEIVTIGDEITISWTEIDDATSYNVYVGDKIVNTEAIEGNEYTFAINAYNGTDGVNITVTAVYGLGESIASEAVNVKVRGKGTIKGTITDGSNVISGANVTIAGTEEFGETETYDNTTTNENGEFKVEALYGSYTMTISKFDYRDAIEEVVVAKSNIVKNITLQQNPTAGEIEVTALDNYDNANISWKSSTTTDVFGDVYRKDLETDEIEELGSATNNYLDEDWAGFTVGTQYQYGITTLVEETITLMNDGFETEKPSVEGSLYNNTFLWKRAENDWYYIDEANTISNYVYPSSGSYAMFVGNPNGYTNKYSTTFITKEIDLTACLSAKLSFYLINISTGTFAENLNVLVREVGKEEWKTLETIESKIENWKKQEISLKDYLGKKIELGFNTVQNLSRIIGVDDIVVTATRNADSRVYWSEAVTKEAWSIFTGKNGTTWNDASNWEGGYPGTSNEILNVIIEAPAVSTSASVKNVVIKEDASLTIEKGGTLTVGGKLTNDNDSRRLIIKDGAQVYQNNENVKATFNMEINNPDTWSQHSTDGWNFVSSPFTNAALSQFVFNVDNSGLDLYRYNGNYEGEEWRNYNVEGNTEFETANFDSGVGYLLAHENKEVVSLYGSLNNAKFNKWELTYTKGKNYANFHLLGNPFTFDMDLRGFHFKNMVEGCAVLNAEGDAYVYKTTGTIPVGDAFFVKATIDNPSVSYGNANSKRGETESINLIATGAEGSDNVIINLSGAENEGFNKLQNFNEGIANIFIAKNDLRYGIANFDNDVTMIDVAFEATQMGNYTIAAQPNGKFKTLTLVDRFTGIETNLLVEDYHFTATSKEDYNRFIVKLEVNSQEPTANGNFAYVSGEDLILNIEGSVQIIDMMGRVVYSSEVESANNRINVSELNNAAYIIRVVNENGVKVQKIIL